MKKLNPVQKLRREKKVYTWTGALFVVGTALLLNYLIGFLPVRLDTSEGKIFSISRGTKDLLGQLEDTLLVKMVFSSDLPPQFKQNERYVRDLLSEYKRASHGKVRIEQVDPNRSDAVKRRVMMAGVAPVQLNVIEKDRREVKESFMGLLLQYGDKTETVAFIQNTQGLEYEISQRIKRLVSPKKNQIGWITNAGALVLSDDSLERFRPVIEEQISVKEVDLNDPIPPDLDALWWVGPSETIPEKQVDVIRSWVQQGKTLGLLLDRYQIQLSQFRGTPFDAGLDRLFEEWGIEQKKGLIADLRSDRIQIQSNRGFIQLVNVVDYPYFPLSIDLNRDNPVTKDIDAISFPFVSAIEINQEKPGLTYTALARSSEYSWWDPQGLNLSPLARHTKPDGAEAGPFTMALAMEGAFPGQADPGQKGRVVLVGTSKLIRTDFPPRPQNFSFFLNLLDWSVQDEALLSIRSKGAELRPLKKFDDTAALFIKFMLVFFLPLLTLVVGLVVWRREKSRRAMLPLVYKAA